MLPILDLIVIAVVTHASKIPVQFVTELLVTEVHKEVGPETLQL